MFFPAIFGRIMLSGNGRYELPSRRSGGAYSFNAARSELAFTTGDLRALKTTRPGIDNGVYRFLLTFESNSYECSAQGDARRATAGVVASRPAGPINGGLTGTMLISQARDLLTYPVPVYRFDIATGTSSVVFPDGVAAQSLHGEILHFGRDSRIKLTDRSGNQTIRRVSDGVSQSFSDFSPAISSSGEQYALVGDYRLRETMFGAIAPPDGREVKIYRANGQALAAFQGYTHPAFRPQGGLVVAGDQQSQRGLFVIDANLRTIRPLVAGYETAQFPSVSPDGQRVAFVSNGETWVSGIDGSNAARVFDARVTRFPTWSPDGRYIAAVMLVTPAGTVVARDVIGIANVNSTERFFLVGTDRTSIGAGNRLRWLPASFPARTQATNTPVSVPSTPASPAAPPAASKVEPFTGRFVGTYVCGNNTTAMELESRAVPTGIMMATFSFGGSNGTPCGQYSMTGRWTDNTFDLVPERWVEQPAGYVMVPIRGSISRDVIEGTVVYSGCGTLTATRK